MLKFRKTPPATKVDAPSVEAPPPLDSTPIERAARELYHQLNFLCDILASSHAVADNLQAIESDGLDENFATVNGELLNTAHELANNCGQSLDSCTGLRQALQKSRQSLESIQQTLQALATRSQDIVGVAGTIDQFAEQTRLLALNARIEAARAGDSGRGFAIVANEIGNLADSVSKESQSIHNVVIDLSDRASDASRQMEEELTGITRQDQVVADLMSINEHLVDTGTQLPELVTNLDQFLSPLEQARDAANHNRLVAITAENVKRNLTDIHQAVRQTIPAKGQANPGFGGEPCKLEAFTDRLAELLTQGRDQDITPQLQALLDDGHSATTCLDAVGKAVQAANMRQKHVHQSVGDYYFNFMVIEKAMAFFDEHIAELPDNGMTVVLGNARGDYHALGRQMVGLFLRASGIRVVDVGAGAQIQTFVDAARESNAKVIGVSSLLVESAKEIRGIRETLDRTGKQNVKIVAGGACFVVDRDFHKEVGADFVATTASDMISIVQQVYGHKPLSHRAAA